MYRVISHKGRILFKGDYVAARDAYNAFQNNGIRCELEYDELATMFATVAKPQSARIVYTY